MSSGVRDQRSRRSGRAPGRLCGGTFLDSEEAPPTACPRHCAAAASPQPLGNEPMPLPALSFPIKPLPRRFSQRDYGGSHF